MTMNKTTKIKITCFIVTLLIYASSGSYTPFMSSYYQLNGMNKMQIGLISCIGPIVAITIQPLWGILSDKTGKRKLVLQTLSLAASFVMALYFLNYSSSLMILCSFLYTSFAMAIIPLANAFITRAARTYNFEYVHVRLGGPVGHSILPLIVGLVIPYFSKSMFVFAGVLYFILFIVLFFVPDEILNFHDNKKSESGKKIFDTNEAIYILILCVINTFGNAIVSTYLGPKVLDMGYNQTTIGILTFVLTCSDAAALLTVPKVVKKYGAFYMMSFAVFISAIRLLFGASNNILCVYLCQAIEGFTYMVAFYTSVNYISEHVYSGLESRAQTLLVMLEAGVGSVLANILGGFLSNVYSTTKTFVIMAIFLIICLIIVNIMYSKRTKGELA